MSGRQPVAAGLVKPNDPARVVRTLRLNGADLALERLTGVEETPAIVRR